MKVHADNSEFRASAHLCAVGLTFYTYSGKRAPVLHGLSVHTRLATPPTANVGVISPALLVSPKINYASVCTCWYFINSPRMIRRMIDYFSGVGHKAVVFVNIHNEEFPLSGVSLCVCVWI